MCFGFDELASLGRSGGLIGVCTGALAARETAMRLLLLLLLVTVMLSEGDWGTWGEGAAETEEAENVEGEGSPEGSVVVLIGTVRVGCGTLMLIVAGVPVLEVMVKLFRPSLGWNCYRPWRMRCAAGARGRKNLRV